MCSGVAAEETRGGVSKGAGACHLILHLNGLVFSSLICKALGKIPLGREKKSGVCENLKSIGLEMSSEILLFSPSPVTRSTHTYLWLASPTWTALISYVLSCLPSKAITVTRTRAPIRFRKQVSPHLWVCKT